MFFTQEDYRKIEKWLLANSVKDTEFAGASLPLKGNETVAFVQDGKNVNVLLKDLIEQIFLLGVSDFLNVTDKYGESRISLTQAIQLIPYKSRKIGQVITFLDEDGEWKLFQFQGERVNQWNNATLWVDLIERIQGISIIDSEDITATVDNLNQTSLTFADKNYNTTDYSGLGRVYLRKNIQRVQNPNTGILYNTNLLTQAMLSKENTIYIIQYDYNLNGQTITIPSSCVLLFEGGSISNGTINFTNTTLEGSPNITTSVSGTLKNNILKPEWFGAKGDGVTDDTNSIQNSIGLLNTSGTLLFNNSQYKITKLLQIYNIHGGCLDFNGAVLLDYVNGDTPLANHAGPSPGIFIGYSDNITIKNLIYKAISKKEGNRASDILGSFISIEGWEYCSNINLDNIIFSESNVKDYLAIVLLGNAYNCTISNIHYNIDVFAGIHCEQWNLPQDERTPHNIHIMNVEAHNMISTEGVISLSGVYNIKVDNCSGEECNTLIKLHAADYSVTKTEQNITFTNCSLINTNVEGIGIFSTSSKNLQTDNPDNLHYIFNNCVFKNNSLKNVYAIRIMNTDSIIYCNNCVIENFKGGINLAEYDSSITPLSGGIRIIGCKLTDSTIFIQNNTGVVIEGCIITLSNEIEDYAINLNTKSTAIIKGNIINSIYSFGDIRNGGDEGTIIENNTFTNEHPPLYLLNITYGENNVIKSNKLLSDSSTYELYPYKVPLNIISPNNNLYIDSYTNDKVCIENTSVVLNGIRNGYEGKTVLIYSNYSTSSITLKHLVNGGVEGDIVSPTNKDIVLTSYFELLFVYMGGLWRTVVLSNQLPIVTTEDLPIAPLKGQMAVTGSSIIIYNNEDYWVNSDGTLIDKVVIV